MYLVNTSDDLALYAAFLLPFYMSHLLFLQSKNVTLD